jgi:hypothetical protein
MSAIQKFKERGFELKVPKENQINFIDNVGCIILFYLDKEEIGTNILCTSESKELNKLIKSFQKELGWENIKKIEFW